MTPRQAELQRQMDEAQAEFNEIDEKLTAKTEPFPDMEDNCTDCQEKLDAIPMDERKVTAILTRKGNEGGLSYFANGASSADVAKFGVSVMQATMQSLEDDDMAKMMFSLEVAMFMKSEIK